MPDGGDFERDREHSRPWGVVLQAQDARLAGTLTRSAPGRKDGLLQGTLLATGIWRKNDSGEVHSLRVTRMCARSSGPADRSQRTEYGKGGLCCSRPRSV